MENTEEISPTTIMVSAHKGDWAPIGQQHCTIRTANCSIVCGRCYAMGARANCMRRKYIFRLFVRVDCVAEQLQ